MKGRCDICKQWKENEDILIYPKEEEGIMFLCKECSCKTSKETKNG